MRLINNIMYAPENNDISNLMMTRKIIIDKKKKITWTEYDNPQDFRDGQHSGVVLLGFDYQTSCDDRSLVQNTS